METFFLKYRERKSKTRRQMRPICSVTLTENNPSIIFLEHHLTSMQSPQVFREQDINTE